MWEWFIGFLTNLLGHIQSFVGDWGLAIILLTVVIRILLTPLITKSSRSMARMQVMQPRLKEIQERYANDPQRQSEELRKAYAELKFNPLGGCLPLLLQMPIFFGLFSVARNVPQDASFYSILPQISASPADVFNAQGILPAIPYIIAMLLFGGLTLSTLFLNNTNQDPAQRKSTLMMGGVMSIMSVFIAWSLPAAVLLYYVTSSLWQVVQQRIITQKVVDEAKKDAELELQNKPVVVDVERKVKKQRPHKKN